jgi:DNA-binding NarL/FixJ family response regulator
MCSISQSCREGASDSQISVLIAGEDGGWQIRFQQELQAGNFLVRRAVSPAQIVSHCKLYSGRVIVADQQFLTDIDVAGEIAVLDLGRTVPILAVAKQDTPTVCARLLRMGCSGVVPEEVEPSILRHAVSRTACGELWASRQLLSRILKEYLLGQGPETFTPREGEVLRMIASRLSNRQIGEKLFISRETVRWHLRSLYAKTGARDRGALISYCSMNGAPLSRKAPSRAVTRAAAASTL